MSGANSGRFFEDFRLGEEIQHATPRTVTEGDLALYQALYGSRFALQSSVEFARTLGFERAPVDDWLVFHIVFGKSVPEISANAVANLGYAEGRFLKPVFAGDTLVARSSVIGLKETSSKKTGIVYVRTSGLNQRGDTILTFVRWVMIPKRDPSASAPQAVVPDLLSAVTPSALAVSAPNFSRFDVCLSGSSRRWGDYSAGERIDHGGGQTIEDAEHQLATRLYQNTARVHFDALFQRDSQFGRRLVYGGHIISLARAMSFNGLENAICIAGLNSGSHVAPAFAGDTVFAWSEILEAAEHASRRDAGYLRVRTVATKNRPAAGFPRILDGKYEPDVILDLDYWTVLPR